MQLINQILKLRGCSVLALPSGGGEDALCPLNTGKSVLLVCLCPTGVSSIFPSNGHCLLKELFVAVLFWQELYRGTGDGGRPW